MSHSTGDDRREEIVPTGDLAELFERIDRHSQRLREHAQELRRFHTDLDGLDQRFRS
ncbi:hypothetical protein [Kibdelosporangium aridum]|uniref:Uncharacterized protein n=1 Tax=Kibdelosporangium aridum TaxID=2030 RepID=A0A1W2FWH6_KIBAR|nr:hypothetical protein [Kibdelosporangium aridum]SMD25948.1 hypothetical protein SAMN05661093_09526 [Kibdelosporangium aridum]